MTDFDAALAGVDARLERTVREAGVPGTAWGVVRDGRLVHAGGAGTLRDGEDRRPDADSVFRIASMTKSFTAATVLLLRDEGRLRLDDPVAAHVPSLATWPLPTSDSVPVTIRDLLSMSAGLATDDPWGDRQQGLPLDEFDRLLAAGPSFAWPPGVVFEYSNLGYGILGRVVTTAAGAEYRHVVRERLLVPLGMAATGYLEEEVPEGRLAHGYVRRGDALVREGRDAYGALASMGGIFTSVRDLSTWVAGFLDAYPARDDPEGPHPLRRSSRREMQQVHRAWGVEVEAHAPDEPPPVAGGGYGLGLATTFDPDLGTFTGHAGGYPGFGSHMAWHPASGLGVIGLGNLRYAPMRTAVDEALAALVRADVVPRRRVVPLAAVERARETVERLLAGWDDAAADALFAMNMDLDEPRAPRRAALAAAVDAVGGPLRRDTDRPATASAPAELGWWRARRARLAAPAREGHAGARAAGADAVRHTGRRPVAGDGVDRLPLARGRGRRPAVLADGVPAAEALDVDRVEPNPSCRGRPVRNHAARPAGGWRWDRQLHLGAGDGARRPCPAPACAGARNWRRHDRYRQRCRTVGR